MFGGKSWSQDLLGDGRREQALEALPCNRFLLELAREERVLDRDRGLVRHDAEQVAIVASVGVAAPLRAEREVAPRDLGGVEDPDHEHSAEVVRDRYVVHMAAQNYYEILGVKRTASADEIQSPGSEGSASRPPPSLAVAVSATMS